MQAILILFAAFVAAGSDRPSSPPPGAQATARESAEQARDRATNESLLEALREKRDEIARSPLPVDDQSHVEARRYALEFLDRQIDKIRKDMQH